MKRCCSVALNQYQPQSNPYNSHLYQRNGWMPPNPFTQSQYVLEHYKPNPMAYCCGQTYSTPYQPKNYGGCCGK